MQATFDLAVEHGRLDTLKRAEMPFVPSQGSLDVCAGNGHLATLAYLGETPSQWGIDLAAGNGIVLAGCDSASSRGAGIATRNGRDGIVRRLAARGVFPPERDMERAARSGYLDVLMGLHAAGARITRKMAVAAAAHGRYILLSWMSRIGVFSPRDRLAEIVAAN